MSNVEYLDETINGVLREIGDYGCRWISGVTKPSRNNESWGYYDPGIIGHLIDKKYLIMLVENANTELPVMKYILTNLGSLKILESYIFVSPSFISQLRHHTED